MGGLAETTSPAHSNRFQKRCFFIGAPLQKSAVSSHFQALAQELIQRGHEAIIIAPPGGALVTEQDFRFQVHSWPSSRPTRIADAWALWRLISRYQPDCLIANFAPVNWMSVVGWIRRVGCRITWYHTPTGMIDVDGVAPRWKSPLQRLRKRIFYWLSTRIVAVSQSACDDAHQAFGISRRKCKVFHNSLRDPWCSHQPAAANRRTDNLVVCVGRLYPTKGQDILIRAVALLKADQKVIHLELIGEGPERRPLEQLATKLSVREQIIFTGNLAHDQVLARLGVASISVVPSRVDAGALTLIESLSVGTAVIASRSGSATEMVAEGVDGLLFDEGSPKSLAEKILLLLSDSSLRIRIGARGRERFLNSFEQSRVISAQADWLEEVVQTPA